MKKNNLYAINWFTIIELIVVISIIWILTVSFMKWYWYLIISSEEDNTKASLQKLWTVVSTIIQKNGDFPYNNYCKNSLWWYDNNSCMLPNNEWICKGNISDLWNIDCDSWCIVVSCSNNYCQNWNSYLDFNKLLEDNNYWNLSISYWNNFSYKICPFRQSNWDITIWKGNFSQIQTSNPSFSLFYNWNTIFEYNSNP